MFVQCNPFGYMLLDFLLAILTSKHPVVLLGNILEGNRHYLEEPFRRRVLLEESLVGHHADVVSWKAHFSGIADRTSHAF